MRVKRGQGLWRFCFSAARCPGCVLLPTSEPRRRMGTGEGVGSDGAVPSHHPTPVYLSSGDGDRCDRLGLAELF